MSEQRNWKSKTDFGDIWNPTKDEDGEPRYKADKEDYIEGVYVDKKTGIGEHDATSYTFETDKGTVSVWGSATLNSEMDNYEFGSYLRIVFEGRKYKKSVSGTPKYTNKNSFWMYSVLYDADYAAAPAKVAPKSEAPSVKAEPISAAPVDNRADDDDLPF